MINHSMAMSSSKILATVFLALFSMSCDKRATKMFYMPDMVDAPTVKVLEDYLDPPENSVSMRAIHYPDDVEQAEAQLSNPLDQNDVNLAGGKKIYNTYCIVCHGDDAKGGGSLTDAYPAAPDITTVDYSNRKDGFFYYRITFGAALMPAYGHSITEKERWQTVQYLRTLQSK